MLPLMGQSREGGSLPEMPPFNAPGAGGGGAAATAAAAAASDGSLPAAARAAALRLRGFSSRHSAGSWKGPAQMPRPAARASSSSAT